MKELKKTAILIPVYNNISYTRKCLQELDCEIINSDLSALFEVVLIDDGSADGTEEYVRSFHPAVHVLKGNGNLWWSGSINLGAGFAINELKVDFVLLWNNDIMFADDYFRQLVGWIAKVDSNTITGSKIYMDESMSMVWSMGGRYDPHTGRIMMTGYQKTDETAYMQTVGAEWLTGMGTLVPVNVIKNIGFWDNKVFPQYHGDLEFTYRAYQAGFKLIVNPALRLANDTTNTGIAHKGNFMQFIRLFNDPRSLYNLRVNVAFIKKYGRGIFKYNHLINSYIILLLSFLKALLFGSKKRNRG